jgi:hypothetical protein
MHERITLIRDKTNVESRLIGTIEYLDSKNSEEIPNQKNSKASVNFNYSNYLINFDNLSFDKIENIISECKDKVNKLNSKIEKREQISDNKIVERSREKEKIVSNLEKQSKERKSENRDDYKIILTWQKQNQ